MNKPTVLTLVDYYTPGYKAGGPIRTISNLVEGLSEEFSFKIITRDRDYKDGQPFHGISVNSWQAVGKALVLYLSPDLLSMRTLRKVIMEIPYDLLYLNSFFSLQFTIRPLMLRRLGRVPAGPVIIATRGELSPGALAIKRFKKRLYLSIAMASGLLNSVIWQASSPYEEEDIRKILGRDVMVCVAPDISLLTNGQATESALRRKRSGCLKVIFLSRITRIKNLDGALRMLSGVKEDMEFNIYGPREDDSYWNECEKAMKALPANIRVNYCGSVHPEQVFRVFQEHDIFLFPTRSENFGHVILESLSAACPVLISDQTPWSNLEESGAGWSFSLGEVDRFQATLQRCANMGESDFAKLRLKAREFASQYNNINHSLEKHRALFQAAICQGSVAFKQL